MLRMDHSGEATLGRLQAALGDRYRVERELGRGGMATVFLAHDERHERNVAIKVLHPDLAASMGAERFEREIKVAARLQNPHILTLYDSGAADGLLFYVMPFVEGESLADRLARTTDHMLPIDDALSITLEVADALGYAHSMGIVHRDIKPDNIMLAGGHALVADFGIARALSDPANQKLTQTGTSVGTPLYMSPEQATGDDVGPTSDLYSLGCVLFEMLTGAPPFTGANARAIMARHTMEQVPSVRLVRDTVPEEVEEAIFAVMAKVPADRPQTATQFAEMLTGGMGTTMTRRLTTRSKPRLTSAARAVRPARKRWMMAAAAALVLVVAGAAWTMLKGSGRGAAVGGLEPRRVGVLYFEDLSDGKDLGYLADGFTEGLIRALSEVQALDVVSKSGSAAYRGSSLALDSIARALDAGTLVRGSIDKEGDRIRVTLRLVDGNEGAEIERASFAGPAGNALAISDSLARQAAALVRRRLGDEVRLREQRQKTSSPEAWVLLQRAERLHKTADSAGATGDTVAMIRGYAQADTLLAQAERADAAWAEPVTMRAALAYRRSRGYIDDQPAAGRWIDAGLGHVARALALDDQSPDALELRGNLRYFRLLMGLEPNPARERAMLDSARADLESAVRLRPSQAGAWSTLSHLYANHPATTGIDVADAATRALEADAFLANANVIQARRFFAYYDLGEPVKAEQSCREGHRRFPDDPKFTECRLWVMTTRAQDPSAVPLAWLLADSLLALTPPRDTAYRRLANGLIVAAVLVRAGLTDSARSVAQRSRGNSTVDRSGDLANIGAFVYALAGDKARAVELLKAYVTANPRYRNTLRTDPGWWFRSLADDPGFQLLVAGTR